MRSLTGGLTRVRQALIRVLRPVLPRGVRRLLRRLDQCLDPALIGLHRLIHRERRPIPPRLLRERVGASTIQSYFETGERYADAVHAGFSAVGRGLADCAEVLDFGAGAGKVLQHLRVDERVQLLACDVHEPSVAWITDNISNVRAFVNRPVPPLPLDGDSIDAAFALSVFTHLPEERQLDWLRELRRVLRPDGLLIASVLGPAGLRIAPSWLASDPIRLDRDGLVFVPYQESGVAAPEFIGSQQVYGLAFASQEYIRRRWSEVMPVVALLDAGLDSLQDVVVLESGFPD